ncbi:hypothetical protein HMPREF1549_01131 [Actinomyces johnsonii F0510]|uniref:Uncharacterized protein n=1 Tax=Actinomyces johnsonii F0510 TaxID=1227262 RepID=U1QEB0_9ACTO|nr:hypothetical protein HMPREF1549_01131 [Actinomyces johnsonii F0510]
MVHSTVTAAQYHRLGALRFSQYQAARNEGRRNSAGVVCDAEAGGCDGVVRRLGARRWDDVDCSGCMGCLVARCLDGAAVLIGSLPYGQ